jgi:murein tripeptide amidase MpaA
MPARTSGLLFAALVSLAMPAGASARMVVIGTSVQGRPIDAWVLGPNSAPRKILVVGVIHGNEQAGLRITSALIRTRARQGVQLWVVPELNPDGVAGVPILIANASQAVVESENAAVATTRNAADTPMTNHEM